MSVWVLRFGLLAVLAAVPASARAGLIVNGGFEADPTPIGGFTQKNVGTTLGGPNGWVVLGHDVLNINTTYKPSNITFNSHSGSNAVDLTGNQNTGLTDGIMQTVSTVVNQVYSLSFFVGRASGSANYAAPAALNLSINGGTYIPFIATAFTSNQVTWTQFRTTFVATTASTTIAFYNGTLATNYVGLDDVDLVATPEPSTVISGGLAVAMSLAYGWRRRRNAMVPAPEPAAS